MYQQTMRYRVQEGVSDIRSNELSRLREYNTLYEVREHFDTWLMYWERIREQHKRQFQITGSLADGYILAKDKINKQTYYIQLVRR